MEVPVYMFTGFLEAGKTKAIRETLEDERFSDGEKTLVLLFEEGVEEIDLSAIPGGNTVIEVIDNEEDVTFDKLTALNKKHRPERVMLEANGMWQIDTVYNNLPKGWFVYQEILFADCKTFENYNQNMRSLVVDKLQTAEMVVFNRPLLNTDKLKFHKIVRGITRRASIAYEYPDGRMEYDEIEDPLPFDITRNPIEIDDRDYALWFRDFAEDMKKYLGKTIKFTAIIAKNKKLKDDIIAGRHIMTCCVDDIEFKGLVCKMPSSENDFKNKEWVKLTAKIAYEYHELYKKEGPVLYITDIKHSQKPEQEVATFY